jgi:hypothetical protein
MLCGCEDAAEIADDFPYPDNLDKPTSGEKQAMAEWWEKIDERQGDCPNNPDKVDPYTLGGF